MTRSLAHWPSPAHQNPNSQASQGGQGGQGAKRPSPSQRMRQKVAESKQAGRSENAPDECTRPKKQKYNGSEWLRLVSAQTRQIDKSSAFPSFPAVPLVSLPSDQKQAHKKDKNPGCLRHRDHTASDHVLFTFDSAAVCCSASALDGSAVDEAQLCARQGWQNSFE